MFQLLHLQVGTDTVLICTMSHTHTVFTVLPETGPNWHLIRNGTGTVSIVFVNVGHTTTVNTCVLLLITWLLLHCSYFGGTLRAREEWEREKEGGQEVRTEGVLGVGSDGERTFWWENNISYMYELPCMRDFVQSSDVVLELVGVMNMNITVCASQLTGL